jgi:hypothetical protein
LSRDDQDLLTAVPPGFIIIVLDALGDRQDLKFNMYGRTSAGISDIRGLTQFLYADTTIHNNAGSKKHALRRTDQPGSKRARATDGDTM